VQLIGFQRVNEKGNTQIESARQKRVCTSVCGDGRDSERKQGAC